MKSTFSMCVASKLNRGTQGLGAVHLGLVFVASLAIMMSSPGCRRKVEPKSTPAPAAAAKSEPKSAIQQRMESPEYVAVLGAIQEERKIKAAEGSAIQTQMEDRAKAVEAENEQAATLRSEVEALRKEIEAKEAALAALVQADPAYLALEAEFKGVQGALEEIRARAFATVHEKLQSQVTSDDAADQPPAGASLRRPAPKLAPTNILEVVRPRAITNGPPIPPQTPRVPATDGGTPES